MRLLTYAGGSRLISCLRTIQVLFSINNNFLFTFYVKLEIIELFTNYVNNSYDFGQPKTRTYECKM